MSAGIFEQANIFVQGFDWCKEQEKMISVASITSKVLCEKHNNNFSPIDQAGIDAVKIIESTLPEYAKSIDTSDVKKYIDGHKFEKWLLKIAINISYNGNNHIGFGMTNSEKGKPSPYLLAVMFGELNFNNKLGLYFLCPNGQYRFKVGSFHVFPVIKSDVIGGFVFHVRGIDFFLNLYPGHEPPTLRSLGCNEPTGERDYILDAQPMYRSPSLTVSNEHNEQQIIYFKW